MKTIDLQTAAGLIDFSAGRADLRGLGEQQLEGALALHNKLVRQRVAYLADEVGMGKTYIALGVVALMRRFNPDLRVLYLLPSVNVRDKWSKDYHSFIEHNYRHADIIVKGIGNSAGPAAPQVTCGNLADLVHALASSAARDCFICTSAFSFALGITAGELEASLDRLVALLPQSRNDAEILSLRQQLRRRRNDSDIEDLKESVKQCWAKVIYRVLPHFDLVVVDEAHNLRKSRDSSARNRMLATALLGEEGDVSRIGRLLLLSATPYDRDLSHLRNQLALFGMTEAAALPDGVELHSTEMQQALHRLMVRRLNELRLDDVPHTRNMYREELRTGAEAEVQMGTAEQLFSALVQKRVSQHLQQNFAGRFELGMLASFESYLPGTVQFDGDPQDSASDSSQPDARDRNVVERLVRSWWDTFDRRLPPHPKMTWVSAQLSRLAFSEGSKQLVFVRRVSSVAELKGKLDEAYDDWLAERLQHDGAVMAWFDVYRAQHCERSAGVTQDEADEDGESSARADNFFTWFYRGRNAELDEQRSPALGTLPSAYRNMLSRTSCLFEAGWNRLPGMPRNLIVDWSRWVVRSSDKPAAQHRFRVAQYAWLQTVVSQCEGTAAAMVAGRILRHAYPDWSAAEPPGIELSDLDALQKDLDRPTLWDCLREQPLLRSLAPEWSQQTFERLSGEVQPALHELKRQLIHIELMALVCRLDHPFIDLYSLRGVRRDEGNADEALMTAFARLLLEQAEQRQPFCSWQILHDIATNLDLLVKLNFPVAYQTRSNELTRYLSSQISPLQPVAGASGENRAERSPLARRFRMPGYPRILVSTDVFQEGEDLHTFCDSVMHYGIPRSPIALEQKVGRVDRVASLAHRRMLANQRESARHFIKVRYPHIRQSLEFLQVRESARSLNDFMLSLGRTQAAQASERELEISQQLIDVSPVEPPLRERLSSLFPVQSADLQGSSQLAKIARQQDALQLRIHHIQQQVTAVLGPPSEDQPLYWRTDDSELVLRTVAGLPELLLSASHEHQPAPEWLVASGKGWASKRIERIQALQADPLLRLQLHHSRDLGWLLRANAEIYAGNRRILQREELHNLLGRLKGEAVVEPLADPQSLLDAMLDDLPCPDGIRVQRSSSQMLCYEFERQGRSQRVRVRTRQGHVVLSSRVLDTSATQELARGGDSLLDSALVHYTLRRNAGFDLVDFHVNSQGELAVRACHPLQWLNREELACMALLVAAEADRLEHIILGGDDQE